MKQKLYALDAFFIEKFKLSENNPPIGSIESKCAFFLYRSICPFITPSIHDHITSNFQQLSFKRNFQLHKHYVIIFFSLTYLRNFLWDWARICLSKGANQKYRRMLETQLSGNKTSSGEIDDLHLYFNTTCDTINLVFNKVEETFQSNTLDWSSLVFIIILSYFFFNSLRLSISPLILNYPRWTFACV